MENFTIHIFGYGETQINSKDLSVKVSTDTLTKVTSLLQTIFTKKPNENTSTIDSYHVINIFGYNNIRWMPKDRNVKPFSVKDDADLIPLVDELIAELQIAKDNMPIEEIVV